MTYWLMNCICLNNFVILFLLVQVIIHTLLTALHFTLLFDFIHFQTDWNTYFTLAYSRKAKTILWNKYLDLKKIIITRSDLFNDNEVVILFEHVFFQKWTIDETKDYIYNLPENKGRLTTILYHSINYYIGWRIYKI